MAHGSRENTKIKQFRYSADNLGYLLYSDRSAIAVDGGAVDDTLAFLESNNLTLKYVTNTHSHGDHTVGNDRLLKKSGAVFVDYRGLINDGLKLDNEPVRVYQTPGHTSDSVIFQVGNVLLTGDTLFIGKIGRCFSGDLRGFLDSIKLIMKFPDNSVIYPGHDYVEEYMEFVRMVDADNQYIDEVIDNYTPELVRSTLVLEKKLNPFLRINDNKIASLLEIRGLPVKTEYDRWESMISLM